ncbi:MAG: FprA family A-type flavoprotein [Syntrophobacterales bacterium]|nr:FprA family A-type flavoprotein [Syntrophobacterales bacterium]
MKGEKITDGIYRLGVNLSGDLLFEGMWPIPDGISINSYVVRGKTTALIDLVEDIGEKPAEYEQALASLSLKPTDIDCLIINHMEPDHTSWLPEFYRRNPDLEFYITAKGAAVLKAFCGIEKNVHIVKTGDTLDLGAGKMLTFYEAPNLHWPETMVTFESSSGVLFSCDAFGSYGAITDTIFDDQLSSDQYDFFMQEALRYYANIVAAFSSFVEKAISLLKNLDIKIIAPSHGIVWRENPGAIIAAYSLLARYMNGPAEPEITVIWSSMYGNTEKVVAAMIQGARSEGIPVHVYRTPKDDIGFILASAWKSAGLIIGMPTYEYRMFPPMAWVLDMFARKKVMNKKVLRFGSFGWSGGAQRELETLTEKLKWDFMSPVEWQGAPTEDVFTLAAARSRELAAKIKAEFGK